MVVEVVNQWKMLGGNILAQNISVTLIPKNLPTGTAENSRGSVLGKPFHPTMFITQYPHLASPVLNFQAILVPIIRAALLATPE